MVQAIARHADLDVTSGIYAHTNLDAMRAALDRIDREARERSLLHGCYMQLHWAAHMIPNRRPNFPLGNVSSKIRILRIGVLI